MFVGSIVIANELLGYLVKEANTDEEIWNLTSKVITDLDKDDFDSFLHQ